MQTVIDTPVRAVDFLSRELPEIGARHAVGLGESWFSYAYLVDNAWIFRFPRTKDAEHAYTKERLLLPLLAPTVDVAVPKIEYAAPLPDGRTFLAHRVIQGEALTRTSVMGVSHSALDDVARQVALFLRAVHCVPLEDARAIGADEEELAGEYEEYRERARQELYPQLPAGAQAACSRLFATFLEDAENFHFTPVLQHADLWGRHILLDDKPSVAGIIDYGCICLGDPDYDFFPTLVDVGAAFTRRVLNHYGHADPDRAIAKGRFFAAFDAIDTWLTGAEEQSDWKVADGRRRLHAALTV
jgi:aminoglycoside 2''-phosphotransferase